MKREPLITIGAIGSAIAAFIVLMQSFGIPITDAQSEAIQDFVVIAVPVIIGLIGRQFVYSPESVDRITRDAAQSGKANVPRPPASKK